MNFEKLLEWGVILLVVILGIRWLSGMFGGGINELPVQPGVYIPGAFNPIYGSGVVVMRPGMMAGQYGLNTGYQGWRGRGRGRR